MGVETVSVIITNYNRENLIKKAVNSILNQTYKNIEIIIIDDCSTDNSEEMIKALSRKHSNIRYQVNPTNKGANYSRNVGVRMANSNYIAFLDCDDQFLPTKIERQMNIMMKYPDVGIVFTNMLVNDKKLNDYNVDFQPNLTSVLYANTLGGFSSILLKKQIFESIGGLNEELPSCQDWNLYIDILCKYKGYMIADGLVEYFIQQDSITKNYNKVIIGNKMTLEKLLWIDELYNKGRNSKKIIHYLNLNIAESYRNLLMMDKARGHYTICLKKKFNLNIFLKLISVSLGLRTYNIIYKLYKNKKLYLDT